MLNQIHIRDLATISELHLSLSHGCTMITGETGAGKSIFIEAIELALGARASQNLVRFGKEKAEINLCFDISHFPKVIASLTETDLFQDNHECIIRRIITNDGRSRSYVNGTPVTLQFVKELGELLFHLHGQHEQQVLLHAETQRDMLDRYADGLSLASSVKNTADTWKTLQQQIEILRNKTQERQERAEYLRFQLNELNDLKLTENEWETLEKEHHRLTHSDELISHLQHILQQITNDDPSLTSNLQNILKSLQTISAFEPLVHDWMQMIDSALLQLHEFTSDVEKYLEKTELDPERLQMVESRVSQIFNLSRKHKINPNQLFAYQEQLAQELKFLDASDDNIQQLISTQEKTAEEYSQFANQLSLKRQHFAKQLEKQITQTIRSLSLPHGEFHIALEKETTHLSPHGYEKIIFQIKTNPDSAWQSLAKVISGGELSRLSLAAHLALANRTAIPTLIFDEVDTGLSGATAEKIGKLLRKLGESYQVFCVTHQPQVAACGHHHLLVEKTFVQGSTHTTLHLLNQNERTREIARMLGGEKITERTLAHADEILQGT